MTALKERLDLPKVRPLPGEPWSFLAQSRSRAGVEHRVDVVQMQDGQLDARCECEASEFRPAIECSHRSAAIALVKAQQGFNEVTQPTQLRPEPKPESAGPMNIDEAMAAIYAEVGYVQKDRRIESGPAKYAYAGEAAVIKAVRDAMVENCVTVRIASVRDVIHEVIEIGNQNSRMQRTTLIAVARFTHGPSSTSVDCEALGEGMDSGDKSSNKAMTGALKYALRQTFCLETGSDPDDSRPENGHHDAPESRQGSKPLAVVANIGPDPETNFKALLKAMPEFKVTRAMILPHLNNDFTAGGMAWYLAADPANTLGTLLSAAKAGFAAELARAER